MRQRLTIVTLAVADHERARAFYETGLGWERAPGSNEHISFFHAGGVILALYGRAALAEDCGVEAEGSGFRGVTLAHNVTDKSAVDAAMADAEAAGARIVQSARDRFWGGYSGYFADPDGHLWEVAWNPYLPLTEDGRPDI